MLSQALHALRSVHCTYQLVRATASPPSRLRSALLAVRVYRRERAR